MKNKILGVIFIVLGFVGIVFLEKYCYTRPFLIDRFLLFIFTDIFIGINIIFDYKKIWNFIYKYRYSIGLIIFAFVIFRGYHGSSMYAYDEIIEPSYKIEESIPIIGNFRAIRSDEYLVDTPAILSQCLHNKDFSKTNDALMARNTTVYMYPQLPTKSISILNNPRLIGFLIFDIEKAYSFYWYFPYFALFFALFELLMILTKKNKLLSLVGTIMLEFSPSLQWWNSPAFLLYGSIATISFYKLFNEKEKIKKILFSILLGWAGSCYIMILYPAWQITYGYLFLGLFIYSIIDNLKNIKLTDFLYLIISILIISVLVIPTIINSMDTINAMMSTVYPGARSSIGGSGWQLYYYYFPSIYYSIFDVGNPCEYGQYISFYPIPIIIGIITCIKNYKNKQKDSLLFILTLVAILLSIWNYIPIGLLAKLTLLSMSTPDRAQLTVGVICIFILIIWMSKYVKENRDIKDKVIYLIISFIFSLFGAYISNKYLPYMTNKMTLLCIILYWILSYSILINTKKSQNIFSIIMIIMGMFFFITIHPINKGLSVLLEKPLSKEIQELNKQNSEYTWVTINAPLHLQSYLLANGARVVNSTNYYPNLELWKKFDPEMKYNEVYNRYAHIVFDLTDDKTNFELIQSDLFRVHLNKNDICKLDVNYIATTTSLEEYEINNLEKIYQKENILIYQIECYTNAIKD